MGDGKKTVFFPVFLPAEDFCGRNGKKPPYNCKLNKNNNFRDISYVIHSCFVNNDNKNVNLLQICFLKKKITHPAQTEAPTHPAPTHSAWRMKTIQTGVGLEPPQQKNRTRAWTPVSQIECIFDENSVWNGNIYIYI